MSPGVEGVDSPEAGVAMIFRKIRVTLWGRWWRPPAFKITSFQQFVHYNQVRCKTTPCMHKWKPVGISGKERRHGPGIAFILMHVSNAESSFP